MRRFEFTRLAGILLLEDEKKGGKLLDCTVCSGLHERVALAAKKIADREYDAVVKRPLPDGGFENVHIAFLETKHLRHLY